MQQAKTATRATVLAMTVAAGMTGLAACAPEPGRCASDLECPFGSVCTGDGVCGQAFGEGGAGGGRGEMGGSEDNGDVLVSALSTTGSFDGTIGGTDVDTASIDVIASTSSVSARFTAVGRPSTFVLLTLPDVAVLSVPGRTELRSTFDGVAAQACNYDDNRSYDETFQDFVIDVSPPRAKTAEDPIIAEDAPPAVVDVAITTVGEGSDVTTTFVMPAAP